MHLIYTSQTNFSDKKLFTEEAFERNTKLYEQMRDMGHFRKLANGTLSSDVFKNCIQQDAFYVEAAEETYQIMLEKALNGNHANELIKYLDKLNGKKYSHNFLCQLPDVYKITARPFANIRPSPSCHHYSHFLVSVAAQVINLS